MILHLSVNYGDSKFYGNIFTGLNSHYENLVFAPLRNSLQANNASLWYNNKYILHKSQIFNNLDRLRQRKKTQKYFEYVVRNIDKVLDIKLIHAHSLFSDGSVALKLKKQYQIKYVVTIRNTDINIFWRYFFWRRPLGRQIIENAEKIIVPSASYKKLLDVRFPGIREKIVVIPNGVDKQFFLMDVKPKRKLSKKLLFIGEFTQNKNILKLIDIVSKNPELQLNVIGFGYLQDRVEKKCQTAKNCIFDGFLSETTEIIKKIDAADVIVIPAKTELFGIALAESVARGRPIVCMRGQGLDGFFDEEPVGEFLEKLNLVRLLKALNKIEESYDFFHRNCLKSRALFSWENIIAKYRFEYEKILLASK